MTTCVDKLCAVLMLSLWVSLAHGGQVWWRARDGSSTGFFQDATWEELQSAITSAQNGSSLTGMVKISGDIARTNVAATELAVTNGGVVTISGGWNWPGGGAEPTLQSGVSVLNAQGAAVGNSSVMQVFDAPDVKLIHLELTGGRQTVAGGYAGLDVAGVSHRFAAEDVRVSANTNTVSSGNAGVRISGTSAGGNLVGIRLCRCAIVGNQGGTSTAAAGLQVGYAGTDASPMVVEYAEISGNHSPFWAGIKTGINDERLFVANSRIEGNSTTDTSVNSGSAISTGGDWGVGGYPGGRIVVFGSVIAGNSGVQCFNIAADDAADKRLHLINCTVVGNTGNFNSLLYRGSQQRRFARLINTIMDHSRVRLTYGSAGGSTHWSHIQFQHSTVRFGSYDYQDSADWHTPAPSNSLAAALAVQDNRPAYRFFSLSTGNTETQAIEGNIDGAADFVASGPHPYVLQPVNPNVMNNGLTRQGSGFTYVDVNINGAYDARVDVIVAGTPPAGDHFVYTTDLLGNRRLAGGEIDRGGYERQPPRGTVVWLK